MTWCGGRLKGASPPPRLYAACPYGLAGLSQEYLPIPLDALEAYFRAFEKAGAMKITER